MNRKDFDFGASHVLQAIYGNTTWYLFDKKLDEYRNNQNKRRGSTNNTHKTILECNVKMHFCWYELPKVILQGDFYK